MGMTTVIKRWTLDELHSLPDDGNKFEDSEVEPDLMVRLPHTGDSNAWSSAPIPSLIFEVFSPTTRRRDQHQKRDLYMDAGVGEYWMVDPERRAFVVLRKGHESRVITDEMTWHPASAASPLVFAVAQVFDGSAQASRAG